MVSMLALSSVVVSGQALWCEELLSEDKRGSVKIRIVKRCGVRTSVVVSRLAFLSVVVKTSVDVNMSCGVRTNVIVLTGVVVPGQALWCQESIEVSGPAPWCQDRRVLSSVVASGRLFRAGTAETDWASMKRRALLVLVRSIDSFCFIVT